jgi:hypothetical protein
MLPTLCLLLYPTLSHLPYYSRPKTLDGGERCHVIITMGIRVTGMSGRLEGNVWKYGVKKSVWLEGEWRRYILHGTFWNGSNIRNVNQSETTKTRTDGMMRGWYIKWILRTEL